MASSHFSRILVLFGALALAREVRAQAGDLDILSRTVPPVVMLQVDTSSSMRTPVLPQQYMTARKTGSTWNYFNKSNQATTQPASFVNTAYNSSGAIYPSTSGTGTGENHQRTCTITNTSSAASTASVVNPGATLWDDDSNVSANIGNAIHGGWWVHCWDMPDDCTHVTEAPSAAGFTDPNTAALYSFGTNCTTVARSRRKSGSGTGFETGHKWTTFQLRNISDTAYTLYSPNYVWWTLQQIYLKAPPTGTGVVPVPFLPQDRLRAAKQALAKLIDDRNPAVGPPTVKFGLAQYGYSKVPANNFDDDGGFIRVPADLNNRTTLLATLAGLNAGDPNDPTEYAGTPLSEALVDVGRYLAGADRLTPYVAYDRNTTDGGITATPPPTPLVSSCEKAFVIVITDGLPSGDLNDEHNGTTDFTTAFGTWKSSPDDGSFLDDVAAGLYAKDLRPTLSGMQNVITYTVGFALDSTLLANAAASGHGSYFTTNNADELADSLTGAISDIVARNTTLTSATVPSTRSAFGNGFYTAYFLPTKPKTVWPGHLQAYTLSPSLVVLDKNDQPAIDPVTNLFYEPRHPHWDVADSLLAGYGDARSIYTTKSAKRVDFTRANLVDPNLPPAATNLVPADLALTAVDMDTYPVPATNVAITDPNAFAGSLKRLGDSIIDFARGVDSFNDDGDASRTDVRNYVFGDVFHSSPVAVGPPLPFLRYETGYGPATDPNTFMATYAHRKRVLYVGANDGMLHGFAAGDFTDPNGAGGGDEYYTQGDGKELFGYVPGFLLPKIKLLPRDNMSAKQYYVDGAPSAADAWIDYNDDGVKQGSEWTTVVLAPMREGGEGILALDVTDPNAISAGTHGPYPRLMWEFTNPGLGQTWSRPIITRVKLRGASGSGDHCGLVDPNDGDCFEKWVAIFGAGYENEANPNMSVYASDPNSVTLSKGRGVFIVDLKTGAVLAQLKQAATGEFANMKYAIPAEPSVIDLDQDGFADLVYIGDVGGQLWKWDIHAIGDPATGPIPTSVWPAARLFESKPATIAGGLLHYHSIFQGAAAALAKGVLTLSFASAERADLGYMGDPSTTDPNDPMGKYDDNNRFWVVQDKHPMDATPFPSNLPIWEAASSGHDGLTDITNTARDDNGADAGYFFKAPEGVKFMTDHIIFEGVVVTLAYLPDINGSGSGNSCALGGTTFEFAWTLENGVGVLSAGSGGSGGPSTPVRSKSLGNGAPTNPRITISKTDTGDIVVNATVQTSSGEVMHPEGLPDGFDPVQQIFWRQDF